MLTKANSPAHLVKSKQSWVAQPATTWAWHSRRLSQWTNCQAASLQQAKWTKWSSLWKISLHLKPVKSLQLRTSCSGLKLRSTHNLFRTPRSTNSFSSLKSQKIKAKSLWLTYLDWLFWKARRRSMWCSDIGNWSRFASSATFLRKIYRTLKLELCRTITRWVLNCWQTFLPQSKDELRWRTRRKPAHSSNSAA